jgi:pyridoxine 5-phosphate synthase
MTRLSVNLNKVALLRNQRDIGYPSVLGTAKTVLDAGAHGITIHPRPDERHIRRSDVPELSSFCAEYNSQNNAKMEFNIEGYPDEEFLALVLAHHCDQVTLVPDAPDQKTSDHGWDVLGRKDFLKDIIKRLKDEGRRVSLFIDPNPETARACAEIGADRVELYTGPYAFDYKLLPDYAETAKAARAMGLGINAGHDLNLDNLAKFIAAIPECDEVSIGHAITADALEMGWRGTITAYNTAIQYGHKTAKAA